MKRFELVQKLINEGLSEKTLVNLSDKQLGDLSKRMLGEALTATMADIKKSPTLQAAAKDPNTPIRVVGEEGDIDESKKKKKKETIYDKALKDLGGEEGVIKFFDKELKNKKKSAVVKKENVEVKNWLETIAEDNFHSMTSKGEIMELIQTKLNEVEVGPNVRKGHNGVPEFMSYDAISNTEVKEASPTTKPAPTKPKVDPGTKPRTPYSPKPGEKSKPKALKEKKDANK